MTYGQVGAVCPQCGRTDAVHSVQELATFARDRLGQLGLGYQAPGYQAPGYQAPPAPPPPPPGFPQPPLSSGFPAPSPSPGFPATAPPSPPPPPPDYADSGPPPGYSGQRRPGRWSSSSRPTSNSSSSSSSDSDESIEDAVAGIVMEAATKFVGRAISRRLKRALDERVAPAMAARQEAMAGRQEGMLREQIAIAERYPDLRACMNDNVAFLAGGRRAVPVPRASLTGGFTLEQADALVAQLRNG